MDRGAWQAAVHGDEKELGMTEVTGCTCVHAYLNLLAVAYVTKIIFCFGLVFNSDAFWWVEVLDFNVMKSFSVVSVF